MRRPMNTNCSAHFLRGGWRRFALTINRNVTGNTRTGVGKEISYNDRRRPSRLTEPIPETTLCLP
jgi:hypothetical protein